MAGTGEANDPGRGGFDRLDAGSRSLAALAANPAIFVYASVALAAALGWWLAISMAGAGARITHPAALGPGMELASRFLPIDGNGLAARLARLCLSADGSVSVAGADTPKVLIALYSMWLAMAVAMMLPTAAPMIRTYAEIADTAAGKSRTVVHVGVLAGGYLVVWALAALAFAALQLALARLTGVVLTAPASHFVSGLVLLGAGLYQFSPLKESCLEKCRNPFSVLFSNWRNHARGVFRLGMRQGLYCLGCCWALMLVMLATGTMNLVWMAALSIFAIVEKSTSGPVTSRVAGVIVTAWGAALLATGLVA